MNLSPEAYAVRITRHSGIELEFSHRRRCWPQVLTWEACGHLLAAPKSLKELDTQCETYQESVHEPLS